MRKSTYLRHIGLLLCLSMLVIACQQAPTNSTGIEVQSPWVRAMTGVQTADQSGLAMPEQPAGQMMGSNTAGYLVIVNHSSEPDRLLRVESDLSEIVELHLSSVENDVMSMHPVDAIEIPAGGQAELKPGSYHIMFIGVKQDLVAGEKATLNLVFEKAGEVSIEADIRAP